MKAENLVIGETYLDINDKKIPLVLMNIEKDVNIGYNSIVSVAQFKPLITDSNKDYCLPPFIYKNFSNDDRSDLILYNPIPLFS